MIQHPKNLSIADFTYDLPEDRIAKYPLAERDASKLLIYQDGDITEDQYRQLPSHLPANSLLVFNNTKVVEARLLFQKASGGVIEIFCLEPHEQYADITTAMQQKGKVWWHCLVGGASKWKSGQLLEKNISDNIRLEAKCMDKKTGSFLIEISWSDQSMSFAELLHLAGAIPLPPYIKRAADETDKNRYQTIYAKQDGSVAAPTAGLHFTPAVLKELEQKNIPTAFVTLHVGAGTFKPVKSEQMADHEMHAEWIDVDRHFIANLKDQLDKNIIAVGTTSLRTLESLYWLGLKCMHPGYNETAPETVSISQWDPYDLQSEQLPASIALGQLLAWMEKNKLEKLITKTQILIAPGYTFRIVKGLITNFHQPQSTLLLLVAALVGNNWKKIYRHALQNNYRFLSYGDGSLLWGGDGY
ncbi:MAG: S-adenosylmethionine:tRNA ribosyltransferase-isomerase [Chitinophagaceae bacterium]|nr:S-adenosylmethionine:tRNA ribosyltransferase-isomerase [Chitinophagaceae bacterium]